MDLNEFFTRIKKIDVQLKESGWNVKDKTKVWVEVDTKQSDFKARHYKVVSETIKNEEESKYADYLLLDSNGDPLAVIEAKRTSKDPIVGQKQAEQYVQDIKKQTEKENFIYFTNGYEIWFWNKPFENPRLILNYHSQEDLERIRFQNYAKKNFSDVEIKKEIIDRPYQIESVKRVLEGIQKGKRKFLIVQATGTGKTRVAMALVDILLRSNRAQKILFLADRTALRNQAHDEGFKVWFPNESKSKVVSGHLDKNARLFTSTIQTFMECYHEFSTGAFDIIISDEAHRSIYNKWKDVFTYFDAVQIGLTATPSDLIDRDTFRFFQCDGQQPASLYTYEQAIKEQYLCDFRVHGAQTHFQIEGINPEDIPDQVKKKLLEEGMEEDDMAWEGTEIEKKVAVIGTNEAIVEEFMDNCLMDETGTLPAKTIFFAVSKQHAKRIWEAFEKKFPQYKGRLTRIITSEDSRAQYLLTEFKTEDFPRIAISIDMLDTGVDVPEVCNLVFAKPVFSKIKFWQMIGRGTRHEKTCKHKEWLPFGKKEYFLIFDFWNNFDYFNMHPQGKEVGPTEAVTTRIFKTRIEQLGLFLGSKQEKHFLDTKAKVLNDINRLPLKSASLKEHLLNIETAKSEKLWDNVGVKPLEFLSNKMTPLMRFQTDVNLNLAAFVLKCEKLGLSILKGDKKSVDTLKTEIGQYLDCLPRSLQQVKDKKELLDKVLSKKFWENVTYDDSQMLIKEFSSLMPYKRAEPRRIIVLDVDDLVKQRKIIEYGIENPKQEYIEVYKEKVENKIKTLASKDPVILKIKEDKV
ncbi:DEAD/DEAH box helicase family protein, partial [Candidatus Woesearchaeota archaeon]|nr:DEAD/DEAH box helicase family protein [Candidatus Woesearchaeota archaeon]